MSNLFMKLNVRQTSENIRDLSTTQQLKQEKKCCMNEINAKNLKLKSGMNDTTISKKMKYSQQTKNCVIKYHPPLFI